jgi:hypothetical protein
MYHYVCNGLQVYAVTVIRPDSSTVTTSLRFSAILALHDAVSSRDVFLFRVISFDVLLDTHSSNSDSRTKWRRLTRFFRQSG